MILFCGVVCVCVPNRRGTQLRQHGGGEKRRITAGTTAVWTFGRHHPKTFVDSILTRREKKKENGHRFTGKLLHQFICFNRQTPRSPSSSLLLLGQRPLQHFLFWKSQRPFTSRAAAAVRTNERLSANCAAFWCRTEVLFPVLPRRTSGF